MKLVMGSITPTRFEWRNQSKQIEQYARGGVEPHVRRYR